MWLNFHIVVFTEDLSFIPKANVFLLLMFLFQRKELRFFFKRGFINLFLDRGGGSRNRGRETLIRERNLSRLPLACALPDLGLGW